MHNRNQKNIHRYENIGIWFEAENTGNKNSTINFKTQVDEQMHQKKKLKDVETNPFFPRNKGI